jgi:hypothetical protein
MVISVARRRDVIIPPTNFPITNETLETGAMSNSFMIPNSLSTMIDIPDKTDANNTAIATIPGAMNSAYPRSPYSTPNAEPSPSPKAQNQMSGTAIELTILDFARKKRITSL